MSRRFERDTIYHVTARGVNRQRIFLNGADRRYFLSSLLGSMSRSDAGLSAYCLMENHVHLLIACRSTPLGVPLHQALTAYAMRFNTANRRSGHLFQARYFSRPTLDLAYLHAAVAYIHANPVRAGLVARVSDWKWSSHADWSRPAGGSTGLTLLSTLTGISTEDLCAEYLRRIEHLESPLPQGLGIQSLIETTAGMLCISAQDLRSGRKGALYTQAKRMLVESALREGHSLRLLAEALRCTPKALTMLIRRSKGTKGTVPLVPVTEGTAPPATLVAT